MGSKFPPQYSILPFLPRLARLLRLGGVCLGMLLVTSQPSFGAEAVTGIEDAAPITSKTFSATGLTLPSLWWVKEQFASKEPFAGKLLSDWSAYPATATQPARIDFLVNRQLWSLLDYLERYSFINEFGAAAREYGYNIRVLDSAEPGRSPIASYICDAKTPNLPCLVNLDSSGKAGFRGRSNTP